MNPSWAVILPFGATSSALRRALELVVRQVTEAGGHAVLAQQCGPGAAEPWQLPLAIHCPLQLASPRLRRGQLVNHAAASLAEDWLVLADPQVLMPWQNVAEALCAADAAVQLVSELGTLDAEQTERVLEGAEAPPETHGPVESVCLGRAGFAVRRDVFLALGGLTEAFHGEGDEGLELVRRLQRSPLPKPSARGLRGTRLWLPRNAADEAARADNKATRARLCAAIDDDFTRYLQERLETSLRPNPERLAQLALTLGHQRAFRVTQPTPPPCRPRVSRGALWAVTALFNPLGFQSRRANYERFREGLSRAGVPLLTVELALGDQPFELNRADADVLLSIRGGDVLWQKERLLNLGIRALPAACDKVVWLDADVLFEREDWAVATAKLLDQLVVVQPFSRSIRLLAGELSADLSRHPIGAGDHEVLHSMAYGVAARGHGCLDRYLEHGHCGYAWAARRDVLQNHGLYEANILGNGDLNAAHAMYGGARYLKSERLSPALHAHLSRWAEAFYQDVGGSVGYVDGTLYHLWHGKKEDRRYLERLSILIEHDFDPELDLDLTPGRALRWGSHKPELHARCREHFVLRREDALA